jgi:hypothetical protein
VLIELTSNFARDRYAAMFSASATDGDSYEALSLTQISRNHLHHYGYVRFDEFVDPIAFQNSREDFLVEPRKRTKLWHPMWIGDKPGIE